MLLYDEAESDRSSMAKDSSPSGASSLAPLELEQNRDLSGLILVLLGWL